MDIRRGRHGRCSRRLDEEGRLSQRFLPLVAVLAVVGGLVALAYSGGQSVAPSGSGEKAAAPSSRPEVPAVTLPRADGGTFSSTSLRGRSPLILSFFATW